MQRTTHLPLSAILMIVVATGCFTTLDVTVKYLSQRYPVPLLVWARWGMQVLVMTAVFGPSALGAGAQHAAKGTCAARSRAHRLVADVLFGAQIPPACRADGSQLFVADHRHRAGRDRPPRSA